ncbi:MAG: hypothetical protein OYM47_17170 [Gemmatimonadota bacterium]|nr:hypothetical protein [Gemmatimonadota bacterium]
MAKTIIGRFIPVFKTGKHRDSEVRERNWTMKDLKLMVSTFKPDGNDPLGIFHQNKD